VKAANDPFCALVWPSFAGISYACRWRDISVFARHSIFG
jgi:hypothetical protein